MSELVAWVLLVLGLAAIVYALSESSETAWVRWVEGLIGVATVLLMAALLIGGW